jgi:hypothetical protein
MKDLGKLEQILDIYDKQNISPCFDITPHNINEEVSLALSKYGFVNSD